MNMMLHLDRMAVKFNQPTNLLEGDTMANKETIRDQQSAEQNQDRKSPGMNQNQSQGQGQDRQQSQDRHQSQQSQGARSDSTQADKSSARIDSDRKDV